MEKVELTDLKKEIVEKIQENYGSVDNFLTTEVGKSLGKNVKTYLYPSGAISFPILSVLCEHFKMGTLSKDVKVTRSIEYSLSNSAPEEKPKRRRVSKKTSV